jgi:hypothetical protein
MAVRSLTITLLAVSLIVFPIAAFWTGGRFVELRNTTDSNQSHGRLSQIRAALLIYHDLHGAFPPTKYQPKPDGPIHSWRVLLLPHIEAGKDAYAEYDFSQEWNSPMNLQALGRIPNFFNLDEASQLTNFVAVANGDDWPVEHPLKSRLVARGKDRFLLVEYPDSDVRWMEPKY